MTSGYLDLYDYRLQVVDLYRQRNQALRDGQDAAAVLERFRSRRDRLFASHSQSALDDEQKARFHGLTYFPYDPAACVEATMVANLEPSHAALPNSGDEALPMRRAATVSFTINGQAATLGVYWIDVYGGGLFLPFRDSTAGAETYGGGRYLFDTVKGSDCLILGRDGDTWRILLDFNYAYNPSCAYNYRWACPLSPPENRLPFPIRAGELRFDFPGSLE